MDTQKRSSVALTVLEKMPFLIFPFIPCSFTTLFCIDKLTYSLLFLPKSPLPLFVSAAFHHVSIAQSFPFPFLFSNHILACIAALASTSLVKVSGRATATTTTTKTARATRQNTTQDRVHQSSFFSQSISVKYTQLTSFIVFDSNARVYVIIFITFSSPANTPASAFHHRNHQQQQFSSPSQSDH